MSIKVAINGYGRIGRAVLRALFEGEKVKQNQIEIVAINDLGSLETNVLLTEFDSVHGRFSKDVAADLGSMSVDGREILIFSERNPEDLPWKKLGIDVVMECTGLFTSSKYASKHLSAGAKKVLISAPGKDVDATIVYGVNHFLLNENHKIVSNASCTTNCLAPVAKILHDQFVLTEGLMTTVHSYTNDQLLVDSFHNDPRRARSATQSMIPTKTGAAAAVGLVLPELAGKLDGFAIRVPTANVSVIDFTVSIKKPTTADTINEIFKEASISKSLENILGINERPLVSIDFNHDSRSSIFDLTQTRVSESGALVKVLSWYDNEWGFSNRMIDTSILLGGL
ncbi:MAG: type I glyceraldehyde-3-phosphate dehydrogenase [Betaproteobacteria bacterium TMED82]|nr:MAG: type I glyceraldehyde-3-phosphate dehydrogenase [Betaproteobacteria bacterium TMED82]